MPNVKNPPAAHRSDTISCSSLHPHSPAVGLDSSGARCKGWPSAKGHLTTTCGGSGCCSLRCRRATPCSWPRCSCRTAACAAGGWPPHHGGLPREQLPRRHGRRLPHVGRPPPQRAAGRLASRNGSALRLRRQHTSGCTAGRRWRRPAAVQQPVSAMQRQQSRQACLWHWSAAKRSSRAQHQRRCSTLCQLALPALQLSYRQTPCQLRPQLRPSRQHQQQSLHLSRLLLPPVLCHLQLRLLRLLHMHSQSSQLQPGSQSSACSVPAAAQPRSAWAREAPRLMAQQSCRPAGPAGRRGRPVHVCLVQHLCRPASPCPSAR